MTQTAARRLWYQVPPRQTAYTSKVSSYCSCFLHSSLDLLLTGEVIFFLIWRESRNLNNVHELIFITIINACIFLKPFLSVMFVRSPLLLHTVTRRLEITLMAITWIHPAKSLSYIIKLHTCILYQNLDSELLAHFLFHSGPVYLTLACHSHGI